MQAFGVNFRVDRQDLFPHLVAVFDALKLAKATEDFGSLEQWHLLLPTEASTHFHWPSEIELQEAASIRASHPVIITAPEDALGMEWDFASLLDAVQNGEYSLIEISKTTETTAELRIDPEAYPYGGIGAFVALVEAHGMFVLGVNEYGKYQPREELHSPQAASASAQRSSPWWKFWE